MIYRIILFVMLAACTASGQTRINQASLDDLEAACKRSHSSSYAVWIDGKPVAAYSANEKNEPIECHSVLKSIASLAVGKLITDGKIADVDTPVFEFYPEWKQGHRKAVTIRHLLNHTSGIEFQVSTLQEWENASNMVQIALCADLVSLPGEYFNYNNKAFMLLMGVIGRAAGMDTHTYFERNILAPLGIENYSWTFDEAGNTTGLSTTSNELVKVGQFLLDKGKWKGRRLIAEEWIDLALQPGQPYAKNCGLMWWLIPKHTTYIVDDAYIEELKEAGISDTLRARFELLKGSYNDVNISEEKLVAVFGPDWQDFLAKEFYPYFPARSRREYSEEIIGYKAEGWLGQYIIIYPDKRLVAARMIENSDAYNAQTDEMLDFEKYVYKLVE